MHGAVCCHGIKLQMVYPKVPCRASSDRLLMPFHRRELVYYRVFPNFCSMSPSCHLYDPVLYYQLLVQLAIITQYTPSALPLPHLR